MLLVSGCLVDRELPGCQGLTSITFTDHDGARYIYAYVEADVYTSNSNSAAGSIRGSKYSGWVLSRPRRNYHYTAAGVLQKVTDKAGVTLLTFQHNASNQLVSVTDTTGRTVTLTRTNGNVTSIADPSGQVWTYGYNANGMLQTVTAPGPSPDVRTYHYESPVAWWLLTGVSVNGVRYSNYAYQSDSRVSQSGLVDGEEIGRASCRERV